MDTTPPAAALDQLRREHRRELGGSPYCITCGRWAPCPVELVLDALDAERARAQAAEREQRELEADCRSYARDIESIAGELCEQRARADQAERALTTLQESTNAYNKKAGEHVQKIVERMDQAEADRDAALASLVERDAEIDYLNGKLRIYRCEAQP